MPQQKHTGISIFFSHFFVKIFDTLSEIRSFHSFILNFYNNNNHEKDTYIEWERKWMWSEMDRIIQLFKNHCNEIWYAHEASM